MKTELLARFSPVMKAGALDLFTKLLDAVDEFSHDDHHNVLCRFAAQYEDDEDGVLAIAMGRVVPPDVGPSLRKAWERENAQLAAHAPESYQRFLSVCASMVWGTRGDTGQLVLDSGFAGTLHCIGADALGRKTGISFSERLFSPIDIDLSDFYLLHPDTGKLCHQTEGLLFEVIDTVDPIEVYLRELHQEVDSSVTLPRQKWQRSATIAR